MPIPKRILQVWIGPVPEPVRWMMTWKKLNPAWEYIKIGNDELLRKRWRNQGLINHYLARCEEVKASGVFVNATGVRFTGEKATLFAWHVLADVTRYELLHEFGGYMPGADTECVAPIPEDAFEGASLYMVNTGYLYRDHMAKMVEKLSNGGLEPADAVRLRRYDPLACAPVMAAEAGHPFLDLCMEELNRLSPSQLGEAVDTTGNVFMARLIRNHADMLGGFVMRPYLKEREAVATGAWRVHHSGTTLNRYKEAR